MVSSGRGGHGGGGTRVNKSIIARQEANVNQANIGLGGDAVGLLAFGGNATVTGNSATSALDQILFNF